MALGLDYNTTWIGIVGGGVSGSVVAGGSVYQIDVWNMGSKPRPARVLVTGKRVGAVAEVGTAHAMVIVTGCQTPQEMHGITSSGLDWEAKAIIQGSALVKTGAKLFTTVAAHAAAEAIDWASQESAKRLVQWWMDDLGVVQPGKQFNLLPSPIGVGVGAGIFYAWQTMHLLGGDVAWQYISPNWWMENINGIVRLQMNNIPEQDGTKVRIGFSVPEWGLDPYIHWKKKKGDTYIDRSHKFQIVGYVYDGYVFERRDGMGLSGINLSNLQPIGRLEQGFLSNSRTQEVQKSGKLRVRPAVFKFSNYEYWTADDTVEMTLDSDGCFVSANDPLKIRT
jgi:hypothetical protein